jgi:RNA polymerase sigma-70 factor (ECF subfamily)
VPSFDDSPAPSLSDEALVAAMAERHDASTVAFVRRYQRRIYGLARALVNDAGVAEEIAQESLVKAWRYASTYDPRRASVERWVLTITRRVAIDYLRRRRADPRDPVEFLNVAVASSDVPFDERVEHGDLRDRLQAALLDLPEEQRRAVVLASLHGRTAAEVADLEGIPLGTSKTRIRNGLLKLRAHPLLEKEPQ